MNGYERKIKELNIGLENAENTYYAIKMELDNAKERIKELEADNAKKIRQIENGMKGTRDLEARIKELEREKAALLKTQEFHLEQIKDLEQTHNLDECPFRNENRELKKRLEELEATISKKETTGWISVKDRLPEEDGLYVVFSEGEKTFVAIYLKEYGWSCYCEVTHWMPLPPPPTEDPAK